MAGMSMNRIVIKTDDNGGITVIYQGYTNKLINIVSRAVEHEPALKEILKTGISIAEKTPTFSNN